MTSREKILAAVKTNQPSEEPLPGLDSIHQVQFDDVVAMFKKVLEGIGGTAREAAHLGEVGSYVKTHFREGDKYITSIDELAGIEKIDSGQDAHALQDVEVGIIRGDFGVAENAAIWVMASSFKVRVFPFICQHLVIVLSKKELVHNMHEAYQRIGTTDYDFGVFIAGPSKTADIEQSLVLGAHGPKSLTVFLMNE